MKFLSLTLCVLLFASCLGPSKINKWVSQHYEGTIPPAPKKTGDFTLTNPLPDSSLRLSSTTSETKHFLPLLFYWHYDYVNTCTLNSCIPYNEWSRSILANASRLALKNKLGGRRVELTIQKIPNGFHLEDDGHLIWLIYAYGWDYLTIDPINNQLVISYRILQGDQELKTGTITINSQDKGVHLKMFQSLKHMTKEYLESYDQNIGLLGKEFVQRLEMELN